MFADYPKFTLVERTLLPSGVMIIIILTEKTLAAPGVIIIINLRKSRNIRGGAGSQKAYVFSYVFLRLLRQRKT